MEYLEHLTELPVWRHPPDYGGFSPDGDYLLYSRSRDSTILDNINYDHILRELRRLDTDGSVYDFRAGHWACGWVEHLIVKKAAPKKVLEKACEFFCELAEYPVIDDTEYSNAQVEAITDYWESCSLSEKVEWCQESGDSIFSARHTIPASVFESDMFY